MTGEIRYVGRVATDRGRPHRIAGFVIKRVFDTVLAVVLIIVFSPLFLLVSLAIRLESRGPVWFNQERVGSKWRVRPGYTEWEVVPFTVHKFRSMHVDGDESTHRDFIKAFVDGSAEQPGDVSAPYKMVDDPRITRVGRLIRRASIDELPQLFNVLAGHMSLVGPRPLPVYEVAQYEPWQMERFHATPGMTGYWQVHGRGIVPFEEQMRMDILYVRNQSLRLDLQLLALTVPAVVSGKGAE